MRYFLVLIPAVIVGFAGFLCYHLGVFKPVRIARETKGPYVMVYKDFVGPYHKTVSVIVEVEEWAKKENLPCELSFGEYPDNPESVEEARLKSRGGCLMPQAPSSALPNGFKLAPLPQREYVVAVFEGSPGIGPMKVYPAVNEFMNNNHLHQQGAVVEIYQIHSRTETDSMTTTYLFPF